MAQLVNAQTGQVEDIHQDQVPGLFMSGKYGFPLDQPVYLRNSTGEMEPVDPQDAHKAVTQAGYKFPTDIDLKDYKEEQLYGDQPLKAGAAAAARTGTFGLSDWALTKGAGVNPETLKGLEKHNQAADIAGSTVAIAGQMMAPELAGPLAGLSKIISPIKQVSKLGQAATKAAAKALPETATLAGDILKQAGSQAAGSAVEGALYSTGHLVSEAALGDPKEVAENAVAQIGLGSLFAGAIGGGLGAAGVVVPKALNRAKASISKAYETGKDLGVKGFAKASSAVSGMAEADINKAAALRNFKFESPEVKEKTAGKFADTLTNQHNAIEETLHKSNRDIRPGEIENLMAQDNINPLVAHEAATGIASKFDEVVNTLKSEPDNYAGGYAKKIEDIKNGLLRDISEETNTFNPINKAKQKLQSLLKNYYKAEKSALPMLERNAGELVNGLSQEINGTLTNPQVWGKAAARQAEYNAAQSEYFDARSQFRKKFMYKLSDGDYRADPGKIKSLFNKTGDPRGDEAYALLQRYMDASHEVVNQVEKTYAAVPTKSFDKEAAASLLGKNQEVIANAQKQAEVSNLYKHLYQPGSTEGNSETLAIGAGLLTGNPLVTAGVAAYNALKNPGHTLARLANLERVVQKTASQIETGVKLMLGGSNLALKLGKGQISAGLSKDFNKSSQEAAKDFSKRITEVQKISQNPEMMLQKVEGATSGLYEHAPNISSALQNTLVSATAFLSSKIPQHPTSGPLGAKWVPTPKEVSKFNRYYEAVHNPMSVLKQAQAGTLTPEALETLTAVYPQLYDQMKKQVFEGLTKQKQPVPYKKRLMLSMFMGQDLDGSTRPSMIMGNQTAYAMPSGQADNQPVKTTAKGLSNINVSERMLTPMQRSSDRKG